MSIEMSAGLQAAYKTAEKDGKLAELREGEFIGFGAGQIVTGADYDVVFMILRQSVPYDAEDQSILIVQKVGGKLEFSVIRRETKNK